MSDYVFDQDCRHAFPRQRFIYFMEWLEDGAETFAAIAEANNVGQGTVAKQCEHVLNRIYHASHASYWLPKKTPSVRSL
jgi:hypothetical protein